VHEQSTTSDPFLANLGQSPAKYDYVVHDCFSGGGVPEHLFTKEFWADLKEIIRDDGVLAVNFAGHLKSDAARAIWFTLQHSFGGCRVFHDRVETNDEKRRVAKEKKAKGERVNEDEHDAFLNMVFFCSPVGKRLDFRPAVQEDFLDSWLRYYILGQLMDNEVTENEIVGDVPQTVVEKIRWVLTDRDNKLGVYQHQSAVEHWKCACEILYPGCGVYILLTGIRSDARASTRRRSMGSVLVSGSYLCMYCLLRVLHHFQLDAFMNPVGPEHRIFGHITAPHSHLHLSTRIQASPYRPHCGFNLTSRFRLDATSNLLASHD